MQASRDRIAFVGVGYTALTRNPDRNEAEVATEACRRAVEDAGLDPSAIDGISVQVHHYPPPDVAAVVRGLGMRTVNWSFDGLGARYVGTGSLGHAARALQDGQCRAVLICKVLNTIAPVMTPPINPETGEVPGADQFEVPYGLGYTMQRMGLIARRYMHRYGITPEQVGWLAVAERRHALRHPYAYQKRPLELSDYLASPWIAEPVRLLDCDIPVNGAVAYLMTRGDLAKDLRREPVYLLAWADALLPESQDRAWEHLLPEPADGLPPRIQAMYREAGLGPEDMNLAFPYDGFSYLALMWLENLGLVPRGEAGRFVEGGERIDVTGELPINTHGGNLSHGRMHGVSHILEAVEQLRGTAGARQVTGKANYAVLGSAFPHTGPAAILGRG
jgi:acetyl-CoA acetyltransferase